MDDDIVYYAGCEAHQYLQKMKMLNQTGDKEILNTAQFLLADSDSENQQQHTNTKSQPQKQAIFAINIQLLSAVHPLIIICLVIIPILSIFMLKIGYFTLITLLAGLFYQLYSSKLNSIDDYTPNKLSKILKDLKNEIPQIVITPEQCQTIWKNIQTILNPLIRIGNKDNIMLGKRDQQFLQNEFYSSEQFHTSISLYKKINKLTKIIQTIQKQMYCNIRTNSILTILHKTYVFSCWMRQINLTTPIINKYVQFILQNYSGNLDCGGVRQQRQREEKKIDKINYYNELFHAIQININQYGKQGFQNKNEILQQTQNLLNLIQLQLLIKESVIKIKGSAHDHHQIQYLQKQESDQVVIYEESARIRHLIDGNYQLSENGQPQFQPNDSIEKELENLKVHLNKIIQKKLEKEEEQARKQAQKQKQEEKHANIYERERRVEGFGMLFKNVKPRMNVQAYYLQ